MTLAALRREILVAATPHRAFELFTGHVGSWWPLATYSVFGDGTVAFEGSELVERSGDRSSVWAEVIGWDPPSSLRLDWHPGSDPSQATDVLVTFLPEEAGTLVTITHQGWERHAQPAAAAEEYGQGWPGVLAGFAEFAVTAGADPVGTS